MPLVKFNPNTFVLGQISVPDPRPWDMVCVWVCVWGGGGGGPRPRPRPLDKGRPRSHKCFFFALKIRGPRPPGSATEYTPFIIIRRLIHVLLKELCHERFHKKVISTKVSETRKWKVLDNTANTKVARMDKIKED